MPIAEFKKKGSLNRAGRVWRQGDRKTVTKEEAAALEGDPWFEVTSDEAADPTPKPRERKQLLADIGEAVLALRETMADDAITVPVVCEVLGYKVSRAELNAAIKALQPKPAKKEAAPKGKAKATMKVVRKSAKDEKTGEGEKASDGDKGAEGGESSGGEASGDEGEDPTTKQTIKV